MFNFGIIQPEVSMYIRQNKSQAKIGYGGYGNFGLVPTSTATGTDPIDGSKVILSGPVHEIGPAAAVLGLLSGAAGAAKQGNLTQARQVMINARGMLGATGSLQSTMGPLVAKVDQFIDSQANATPSVSINIASAKSNTLLLVALGGLAVFGVLMMVRR